MKKLELLLLTALVMMAASCGTTKNITMMQDMDTKTIYTAREIPQAKIRKGDKLSIYVTCKNAALAAPFNLAIGTQIDVESEGQSSRISENTKSYVVDQNGDINFPVLGMLHVEGLTIEELKNDIQNRIIAKNYIKDPIVLAEFINFQITTIGEINAVHTITNGSINILEVVAMSGGIPEKAKYDDLWVIRTEGNTRRIYSINLKSKTLFDSPAYYLQQGDIVYVKPRRSSSQNPAAVQALMTTTTTLSSLSMIFYWVSSAFGWTKTK